MTTLNLSVGANTGDGRFATGSYSNTDNFQYLAHSSISDMTGFSHYTNVTIAPGSTINTAVHVVNAWTDTGANGHTTFKFVNEDNAATIASEADGTGRAVTAGVNWSSIPSFTADVDATSIDFASILQAVIDRAGWASGNSVVLYSINNASSSRRAGQSRNWDSVNPPRLNITYTAGGGGGLSIPVAMAQYRQRWR